MTNPCTCKAEHWQPHADTCPAKVQRPLLTLENIRSGAFPLDAHAVGFLMGEVERLRALLREVADALEKDGRFPATVPAIRAELSQHTHEPDGVLTIARDITTVSPNFRVTAMVSPLPDGVLSTLNAAQTARLKAAIDHAGLTPKQWERFMNSFMDVEDKSPTDPRAPLPPDILADAQQDVVHQDTGAVRVGRSVKFETPSCIFRDGCLDTTGMCAREGRCCARDEKSNQRLAGCSNWKPKHGVGPYCGNCGFHQSEHQR